MDKKEIITLLKVGTNVQNADIYCQMIAIFASTAVKNLQYYLRKMTKQKCLKISQVR